MEGVTYIDEVDISDKRVLLKVDFSVTLNPDSSIADDARIKQSIPTINRLLENNNQIVLISHLGRPDGKRVPELSMNIVIKKLEEIFPNKEFELIEDFTKSSPEFDGNPNKIYVLENIRYHAEEKNNDLEFSKKLASLGDVFVNDAFAVSHRAHASTVGVAAHLPSYGGLLLRKELTLISEGLKSGEKPIVSIIGGSKMITKIAVMEKLLDVSDYLIVGGALANTFLFAQGFEVGNSLYEYEEAEQARRILYLAAQSDVSLLLPADVALGDPKVHNNDVVIKKVENLEKNDPSILDIGPETEARYGKVIGQAKTIIWNGPMGLIEIPEFKRGTDFIYYSIAHNDEAVSIVGGGDTLAAISKKEYLDKITHISTGGGAMLEFIEKGTLAGVEALRE